MIEIYNKKNLKTFNSGDYIDDIGLQTIIQKIEKLKKQRLRIFEFGFRARFFFLFIN